MRGEESVIEHKRDEERRRSDGRRREEEQLQGSVAAKPRRQATCKAVSVR